MKTSWMVVTAAALLFITAIGGCGKTSSAQSSAAQNASTKSPANPPANIPAATADAPAIVPGPDGTLALAHPNGAPVDGIKLSQYDQLIYSPCIAVGADGVIHVAFVEQLPTSPYPQFVYHRQSTDGGKTWSDPKNLSEDMPGVAVGTCKLIIDKQNRTYVIWRTGIKQYSNPGQQEAQSAVSNLVYRCLDNGTGNGTWSKILPVHKPTSQTQDDGSMSFLATIDGSGKAQVIYNTSPNRFHPKEALAPGGMTVGGIGWGLIFQTTLDGSTPAAPHEWYMAPIKTNPANPYDRKCDGFNALDGYVDAAGQPHLIAQLVNLNDQNVNMQVIENGKQTPAITLPPDAFGEFAVHPPRLLLDAKGGRHIIAKYDGGEHPSIRDYLLGSTDDPTIIMAAKPPGIISDFRAYQGPNGKMAAIIETQDKQTSGDGDSWLCTNDNGKWSQPICLTNNAGRKSWVSKNTGSLGNVATGASYGPGPGAAAWDKDGHIVIALINNKNGAFALSAGGVTYAGDTTSTPMLFFYRL